MSEIIDLSTLQNERKLLKTDFDTLSGRINQVEKDLTTMKGNLNAVYGALQQVDKLIKKIDISKEEKELLVEKGK
jgi:hypothetical protein